ncbi:hypothetical protein BV898_18722 [Hypsibius exemplaris]|uniref:Uncharacterized protein n=1 Tax=Hypsibius exemplaris TaxID=2072580 RepID=A0A9X6NJE0_HYPEX|nr:hypothetical protein BV898_18722 [Hypsibius exemplaris]
MHVTYGPPFHTSRVIDPCPWDVVEYSQLMLLLLLLHHACNTFLGGDASTAHRTAPLERAANWLIILNGLFGLWPQLSVNHPGRLKSGHLSGEILPHGSTAGYIGPHPLARLGIEFVVTTSPQIIHRLLLSFILLQERQLRRHKIRPGAAFWSVQTGGPRLSSSTAARGWLPVTLKPPFSHLDHLMKLNASTRT